MTFGLQFGLGFGRGGALGKAVAPAGFAFKVDGTETPVVDGTGQPILIRIA